VGLGWNVQGKIEMNIAKELRRMGWKPDQIATATINGKPLSEADSNNHDSALIVAPGVLRIVVFGSLVGKPRMTQRDKWKQRPCVMRYRDWCDRVRAVVGKMLPASGFVQSLDWIAYFEPPKSWKKQRRVSCIGQLHCARPDRDNIDKAVLDCLYKEDSGIAMGTIQKRWGWAARIEITVNYDN